MSIVPYRHDRGNHVVYHDPHSQIMVVHNHQQNTVQLLENFALAEAGASMPSAPPNSYFRRDSGPPLRPCCPNCGYELPDFETPEYRPRRESSEGNGRRKSSGRSRTPPSALFPRSELQYMHQDYFKLLSTLPFSGYSGSERVLAAPPHVSETHVLSNELFNQGYFDRFFKKVPPEVLGSGAHAQVYKVVHVLQNIQLGVFAVKRINIGDSPRFLEHVLNEVLILYELSLKGANEHNLIRYNHVWMEYGDLADSAAFLMGDGKSLPEPGRLPFVFILQQYCDGGHLEALIELNFLKTKNLSTKERAERERLRRRKSRRGEVGPNESVAWLLDLEIWKFFSDIATAVAYLHSHGILHRDLKPSNCLLESRYVPTETPDSLDDETFDALILQMPKVLVTDFGEGKFVHSLEVEERGGNTGTLEFTHPKLWEYSLFGEPRYAHQFTFESDIYLLGMTLCFLCVGTLPFANAVAGLNDPVTVRLIIAKWFSALTLETFNKWFLEELQKRNSEDTDAMDSFAMLIFSMLKGRQDGSRLSADDVCQYLLAMRAEFTKNLHGTITELDRAGEIDLTVQGEEITAQGSQFDLNRLAMLAVFLLNFSVLHATGSAILLKFVNLLGLGATALSMVSSTRIRFVVLAAGALVLAVTMNGAMNFRSNESQ